MFNWAPGIREHKNFQKDRAKERIKKSTRLIEKTKQMSWEQSYVRLIDVLNKQFAIFFFFFLSILFASICIYLHHFCHAQMLMNLDHSQGLDSLYFRLNVA